MERADLGHVTLTYTDAGSDEPVVFVHGAFVADAFLPLMAVPALADRFRLVTYHRRGYTGSSPVAEIPAVQDQATDCLALLRYLGIDRAHVVGHSLGGSIALQLALDAPDLVYSLVLLEPALFVGTSADAYRASLRQGPRRYQEMGPAAVEEFFRSRWTGFTPAALDWAFGEVEARRIERPGLVVLGGGSPALSPRFEDTYHFLLAHLSHAGEFVLPARRISCTWSRRRGPGRWRRRSPPSSPAIPSPDRSTGPCGPG